ncbi:MAG: PIN domain-containing protein [Nitrosomonadales bacterium]|nr:PIN domain-containing protein [Nitrosomonadales bacterium]
MTERGAEMPVFLDSNIVLYALGDDDKKSRIAAALIEASPWISTQVINECSHVLHRKLQWSPGKIDEHLSAMLRLVQLADVGLSEIRSAWALAERYGFGHYDSLIVAAALHTGSATLYTEDMRHEQVIEGRLTLINPFV